MLINYIKRDITICSLHWQNTVTSRWYYEDIIRMNYNEGIHNSKVKSV